MCGMELSIHKYVEVIIYPWPYLDDHLANICQHKRHNIYVIRYVPNPNPTPKLIYNIIREWDIKNALSSTYWKQNSNAVCNLIMESIPDSKVHGANMGPTWGQQASDGPHVGPMNLAIRDVYRSAMQKNISLVKKKKFLWLIFLPAVAHNCLQHNNINIHTIISSWHANINHITGPFSLYLEFIKNTHIWASELYHGVYILTIFFFRKLAML